LGTVLRQPSPRISFIFKRLAILLKGIWLARQLQHESVDLIHTHFAWLSAIAGIVVSQLLGIPFTLTAHAYDIYGLKNDLLRLATGAADGIVTISETNKRAILAMNPSLDSAKIRVLRCGVDLERFRPAVNPLRTKTLEIMSVGRLMAKKGHEYLIRACAELEAQQVDFHCTIVGIGNLEQRLRNLIRELGLESRVDLVGPQSQEWIRDRLLHSDVFILACVTDLSGDRDGVPVSIMEAMAMGVPVISTPVSGIPELVRDGETGLLVPERDAKELAAAVVRLQNDGGLRSRLVRNGLELISSEYDIRKNTDQLKVFFQASVQTSRQVAGSLT
jgi:glycosyltransferase involved in cell wall biosynthesis